MFARQLRSSSARLARVSVSPLGVRHASSVPLASRLSGAADCAVYWTKVTGEVFKQVYQKEGLAPPSGAEFSKVFESAKSQSLAFVKNPKAAVSSAVKTGQSFTGNDYLKYAAYLIQVLGCFALGEVIGRRKFVGYPSYGPKKD